MYDVVALGELLIDFTYQNQNSCHYPVMSAHPGGAPANFLAVLSKYGAHTALLGKVGCDNFGHLLFNTLQDIGVDSSGLVFDPNTFTTLAFVTLDEKGERTFSFARKPGADTQLRFEELNLSLIEQTKVFHFGSLSLTHEPSRSMTYSAVAYAKEQGKLITFDPNLRLPLWEDPETAKTQIRWGLRQADVVKISDEEVSFLFDMDPQTGATHILSHYGAQLVFVTCGADGSWFATPSDCEHISCPKHISAIDTTGAGDIFGGAAVWKMLQLDKEPCELTAGELRDITQFACTAASLSTTKPGGIFSVPEYKDVCNLLHN